MENRTELLLKLVGLTEAQNLFPRQVSGGMGFAGVPTSYLAKLISTSWPWLHTYMDDFNVVDINGLKIVAEIAATTIWRLANE